MLDVRDAIISPVAVSECSQYDKWLITEVDCLRPIIVEKDGVRIKVPCGKCTICRKRKAYEWSIRLIHEFDYYKQGIFFTLTYNDENLPFNDNGFATLRKKYLISWKNLVLKVYQEENPNLDFKYFLVGEYGDQGSRPHYHGVILGARPQDVEYFRMCWNKGFSQVSVLTDKRIYYTAGYMVKKLYNSEFTQDEFGFRTEYDRYGVERPFSIQSRGIGKRYLIDHLEEIVKHDFTLRDPFGGKNVPLPRYYCKLMDQIDPSYQIEREQKSFERAKKKFEGLSLQDASQIVATNEKTKKFKNLSLQQISNMKKRKN